MSTADLTLAELDAFGSREQLVDELVHRAAQSCGIAIPRWSWTRRDRGAANESAQSITVPYWCGNDSEGPDRAWWAGHRTLLFLAYYAVHEVCHLPPDSYGHGAEFKQYERDALAELGIGIRYMRNYPSVLFDIETGDELYVSSKEHDRRVRRAALARDRARRAELLAAGESPSGRGYKLVGSRWIPAERFGEEWLPVE